MTFAVFNCITIPLKVAFNPESFSTLGFQLFNNFIDICFLMDIFVTFRTILIEEDGDEITDLKEIAKNYLTGMFIIDVCATVPID